MKIAHISDFHLNTFYSDSNLERINSLFEHLVRKKFDHIVITGDLTDNADQEDFKILRELFEYFDLLDGSKLSLIPGNHDIFGGPQTAEDIFTFPERCKRLNYKEKLDEFISFFPETFNNCIYVSDKKIFPFAKNIFGSLIIGLNSTAVYSYIRNPFASNGEIDIEQFNEIVNIFNEHRSSAKHSIVLIHHHFNKLKTNKKKQTASFWQKIEKQTMKLRKKKRLLTLFNQFNVDMILHGHIHENKEYERDGLRIVNGGGSIKRYEGEGLRYNEIEMKNGKVEIKIIKLPFVENHYRLIQNRECSNKLLVTLN